MIIERGYWRENETRQVNILDVCGESTGDILLPMLRHSYGLSQTYISYDSIAEEDKEEEYFEPIPELFVYVILLESQIDPIEPISNKKRKIIPQQLISIATLHTKSMVSNFTWNINKRRLSRVNQTRVKLKVLDTGNRKPNIDARKLPHMWGIRV